VGADHWGGYATERARIADLISAIEIQGLLMVAGDAHMLAIDDGSNTQFSAVGETSFPLLHAAALDRPGSVKGGPYSEGVFPGGGQFATIEIRDTGSDEIAVTLTGLDWTGATLVEYTFVVDSSEVGR
jgi:phosphodiesterase/alkaline phosphatase D-like protein